MKVYVSLPKSEKSVAELGRRLADFHAELLIEKIGKLNISNRDKMRIVDKILEELNRAS